jgi:hypothetical protein
VVKPAPIVAKLKPIELPPIPAQAIDPSELESLCLNYDDFEISVVADSTVCGPAKTRPGFNLQ